MKKITTLLMTGALMGVGFSQITGTWTLAPVETALAVGPAKGDFGWWKVPAAEITSARTCQFDDEFVFNADGTFQNKLQNSTFLEGWQGGSFSCGTPVAPFDGTASATWKYNATNNTITIYGKGAYLGLPKAFNGGELANVADAKDSLVYEVAVNGNVMSLDISIGSGYWHFELKKQMPALDPTGLWKLRPVGTSLAVGPAKGDFAWWTVPTGEISGVRACQYDDIFKFNADGSFNNIMQGSTFLEGWQGGSFACGTPVAPHDGSTAGAWVADKDKGTITLIGKGSFLGLAKVYNGGELTASANAKDTITYEALINADTMLVDISIGSGYWHFEFEKTTEPANKLYALNASNMEIYPNPSSGDFQINMKNGVMISNVKIMALTGQVIEQMNIHAIKANISTDNLTTGTYLVSVETEQGTVVERFVKK